MVVIIGLIGLFSQEDSNLRSGDSSKVQEAPKAKSLADATDMLFASEGAHDTLKVKFFRKSVWDEAGWVHTMARGTIDLAKFLSINLPDSFSVVKILAHAPTTDKYGNSEAVPAMLLIFDGKDFDKINYENFSEWKMLNLVQEVRFEPIGKRAALKYCEDSDNAEYAKAFCVKVLASALGG